MLWSDTSGGINFEPAPAGTHIARCYQIIDLGTQYSDLYENSQHKVFIGFELPTEINKWEKDGESFEAPYTVGKFYTMSLNEKATLRHDLESWRGKPFTDDELAGFNPQNILGVPALISVIHKTKNEKTKAIISSISKPMPAMTCPPQIHDTIYFTLDEFTHDLFDTLPEGFQKMIKKSDQWTLLDKGLPTSEDKTPTPAKPQEDFKDDDIPF